MRVLRSVLSRVVPATGLLLLAACAATPAPQGAPVATAPSASAPAAGPVATAPSNYGLTGTRWQLAEIQLDDGPTRAQPADPSRYTVQFGPEGQATVQVDCNRGQATWRVQPMGDGHTGPLRFDGLRLSETTCGPSPLGPRVAAALPQVRGYMMRNGQLFLSLAGDAGLLTWSPAR